jgi:hypothetical protein
VVRSGPSARSRPRAALTGIAAGAATRNGSYFWTWPAWLLASMFWSDVVRLDLPFKP